MKWKPPNGVIDRITNCIQWWITGGGHVKTRLVWDRSLWRLLLFKRVHNRWVTSPGPWGCCVVHSSTSLVYPFAWKISMIDKIEEIFIQEWNRKMNSRNLQYCYRRLFFIHLQLTYLSSSSARARLINTITEGLLCYPEVPPWTDCSMDATGDKGVIVF